MSEGNNGSALLAGNPAGESAVGNGSENATNTTTNTAPPADTSATGNWYDKFENDELKGYVQNKGWKDPAELAVGYQNLEKLLGGEKLPMPKGADDAEGWSRVYDSLGRPTAATDYKMGLPEGADPTFSNAAAEKFYEIGLSSKQAEALSAWYIEQANSAQTANTELMEHKAEQDLTNLRHEWGGAFDENVELGRRAAREFGLGQQKLTALEAALGTADMMKLMSQIGRGMTEDKFVSGGSTNSFGMTPAAAQQRVNALKADPAWSAKYISGDADARAEMQRLMSLAFPE